MNFRNEYFFLSNFFTTPIEWCGVKWPCVENAYQAAKGPSREWEKVAKMTPGQAKRWGRQFPPAPDREDIMWVLLGLKFSDPWLKRRLKGIQGDIVEDNMWCDTYWGVCHCRIHKGYGVNLLGKMLMALRDGKDWRSYENRPL